jgi:hypothetical protein
MPTLLVGHANRRDGVAQLRTWEHVDAICRERFNQGAPVDPAQYEQFLQSAQGFLAACGMRVSLEDRPRDLGAPRADAEESARPSAGRRTIARAMLVATGTLFALLAAWSLLGAK